MTINLMKITPQEADYLLYALDAYCKTDSRGTLTINPQCNNSASGLAPIQDLRDRLFCWHDHKET